ncbi:MAG: glycosyltransferase family 2 protein [Bacillota bacterium]|jgi:glycosyltransferase
MHKLKVSIITPCYNSGATIQDTINSVRCQSYNNIEHIFVDGGSTDATLMVIEQYEKNSINVVYVSEPDKGIYDAMNKGIRLATGDIIGILNSDDFLAGARIIEQIVNAFEESRCDVLYGNINYVNPIDTREVQREWVAGRGKFENGWSFGHPSMYVHKRLYDEFGLYKTEYRIASDYDFMLRLNRMGRSTKFHYLDELIVTMRNGGESTRNFWSNCVGFMEAQRSLKEYEYEHPTLVNIARVLRKLKQFGA